MESRIDDSLNEIRGWVGEADAGYQFSRPEPEVEEETPDVPEAPPDFRLPEAEDFELDPITPQEYVEQQHRKGMRIWPVITENLIEMFSGPNFAPKYRCYVSLGGIGAGKTTEVEVFWGYLADWMMRLKSPPEALGLRRIDTVAIMNLAPTMGKAKDILFSKFRAHIHSNERLQSFEPRDLDREIFFRRKRVKFSSGSSSVYDPQGADLFAAVIDECTSFVTQTGDKVKMLYEAMNHRRRTRFGPYGTIIMIGEGGKDRCFAEKLMADSETDDTILARRRSNYDSNPKQIPLDRFEFDFTYQDYYGKNKTVKLRPPLKLKNEYEISKAEAIRSNDGYPSATENPFFNYDAFVALLDKNRTDLVPDPGDDKQYLPANLWNVLQSWVPDDTAIYAIHIDLGTGNMARGNHPTGFAVAHLDPTSPPEAPRAVLDFAVRFFMPNGEVDWGPIRQLIIDLDKHRAMKIGSVTYDQWQSKESVKILADLGYPAEEYSVKRDQFLVFRTAYHEQRVSVPHDNELLREVRSLEDGDTNVYPGIGSFDDELMAAVGAVSRCLLGLVEAPAIKKRLPRPRLGNRVAAPIRMVPRPGSQKGPAFRSGMHQPPSWRK